jgi:type II secretory ATPase GspE/PulE/Tfp pilus assembly ATPase PilB-like protein
MPISSEGIEYEIENPSQIVGDTVFYRGEGCEACKGTGYRGMTGIIEVVQFTEDLREAIVKNATVSQIEDLAISKGFQTMAGDALQKVKSGLIHFDDIYHILLEKSR